MKNFLKTIAFLCACLMMVSAFAGCNKENTPDAAADSSDVSSAEETSVETKNDQDELGEHDFGKKEFNILARESTMYEYSVEFTTSMSQVDRQVYERNQEVEKRFNVILKVIPTAGDNADRTAFTNLLATDISSGAASYHMASAHGTVISPQQFQGHCIDLHKLPEFNPAKEWWSEEFYNECNFGGKLYFAMGDIAYTMYEYLEVLFVNETKYAEKKVGGGDVNDLYELVKDGEWTWEVFQGYVKNYAGGVDMGEDAQEYGLVLNLHSFRAFLPATDTTFTYREGDNTIRLYEVPSEKMVNLFDRSKELFLNRADVLCPNTNYLETETQNPIFSSGRALFYGQQLGQATALREMKDSYGVIPFPKYDELQEAYYSTCSNEVSAVMVPSNVAESDYTLVGAIVEAMAMYGYQKVVPMYYDQVLSKQILNSDNGQAMLKLIRESFMIDFSLAYTFGFGATHPYAVYKQAFFGNGTELTSYWTSKYDNLNGKLEAMYRNIEKFSNEIR